MALFPCLHGLLDPSRGVWPAEGQRVPHKSMGPGGRRPSCLGLRPMLFSPRDFKQFLKINPSSKLSDLLPLAEMIQKNVC